MVSLEEDQREAVNKLKNGNILCGNVGAGKSRIALAYYISKVCGGRIRSKDQVPHIEIERNVDLYIITTARKRDTLDWESEMVPFLLSSKKDICRYDVNVKVDSWNNISKYVDVKNAFFIFDEQRVVGKGVWVKSFLKITKQNQWILLSATPGDDWEDYIPVFIANGFYKNRSEFLNRHAVYSYFTTFPKIDRFVETNRLEKLRNDILVFTKYGSKTRPVKVLMQANYNREQYRTLFKDRWNFYDDEPIQNVSELCYLIRKVVNSDESRVNIVLDIIEKHKKVIVFYNFDYELEILREMCDNNGLLYSEWNGHLHQPIPHGDSWIYLVQYTAGAEGWNCIETNVIVFYSLNYSYKIMVQSAGRIDRRNTPFTELHYFYIYSHAPIDLGIRRALKNKKKFNERSFIAKNDKK